MYIALEVMLDAIDVPKDLFPADVYSLGVVLYTMLTSQLPPQSKSQRKFVSDTKEHIYEINRDSAGVVLFRNEQFVDSLCRHLTPRWEAPADSGLELAKSMMNPMASKHPTMDMVVRHPWLVQL